MRWDGEGQKGGSTRAEPSEVPVAEVPVAEVPVAEVPVTEVPFPELATTRAEEGG